MATSTVQDVVSDAKKLANRLKKYDATTDSLLAKAQTLEKTVDSMKEVSVVPVSASSLRDSQSQMGKDVRET